MDSFVYLLPAGFNLKKLQKNLSSKTAHSLSLEQGDVHEAMIRDTFDGDLRAANKLLFEYDSTLLLLDLFSGQMVSQKAVGQWSLAADLENGPVASELTKLSKLRTYLPVAAGSLTERRGALLDDERKTRARFRILTVAANDKTLNIVATTSLRGYSKAHQHLCRGLAKIGSAPCEGVDQVYTFLQVEMQAYDAKPQIKLDPLGPAKASATAIISTYLQVARRNEEGVIGDYDTEFLHDYRVSLRKVRSVLSLFKGVYGDDDTVWLKKEISTIMQHTNMLRDLDVYLLGKRQYYQLVPEETHAGLDALFAYIEDQRQRQFKSVRKLFQQKKYRKKMQSLVKLFDRDSRLAAGARGNAGSLEYGCRLLLKRYHKVCRIAGTIDGETEDAVVHELRINCKKLRYLMEFFAPLFPAGEIKALIKALKMLQDNLGDFNDYSVQQLFLRRLLEEEIGVFGENKLLVIESIGALTAMLYRLQREERGLVMRNFARFDSDQTRTAVANLFDIKGQPS